MNTTTPHLLTIREAAATLKMSYEQTRQRVVDGRLPSIALGRRSRRVPAYQLAKFVSANTTGGN